MSRCCFGPHQKHLRHRRWAPGIIVISWYRGYNMVKTWSYRGYIVVKTEIDRERVSEREIV